MKEAIALRRLCPVVDIWGMCPGRYTKRNNRLTPKTH
jgi:hypothetical protein